MTKIKLSQSSLFYKSTPEPVHFVCPLERVLVARVWADQSDGLSDLIVSGCAMSPPRAGYCTYDIVSEDSCLSDGGDSLWRTGSRIMLLVHPVSLHVHYDSRVICRKYALTALLYHCQYLLLPWHDALPQVTKGQLGIQLVS